jgi:hypothetical protein
VRSSTPDPVTGTADRETHGAELHPETVAAYIAKYATKAAADLPHRPARRQRAPAASADHAAAAGRPRSFAALAAVEEPVQGLGSGGSTCSASAATWPPSPAATRPPSAGSARPAATTPAAPSCRP